MEKESGLTSAPDFSMKTWKEDVVLRVEGKELHAAKNVLAYLSPVFEAMFSHPFSEKDKAEVELPGKQYESFLEFMRCIYPGSKRTITVDNVFQVLPLADEYQVKELRENCEKFVRKFIGDRSTTLQELLNCLAVSERYHMTKIKDLCIDRIEYKIGCLPGEIVTVDIDPICKYTMFELMKRVLVGDQLELVKHYMVKCADQNYIFDEWDYEGFHYDSALVEIDLVSKDVSSKLTSNLLVVDSKRSEHTFYGYALSINARYDFENNKAKFGIYLKMYPREDEIGQGWSCRLTGRLILKNSHSLDLVRQVEETFTEEEPEFGFPEFEEMSEILDIRKGYIFEDELRISAVLFVRCPDI